MLALGLQGSPRRKGNSELLLNALMQEFGRLGIETHTVDVCRRHIEPCKELTVCEKRGVCPIEDDMGKEIFGLLRRADIVVAASPIFFYNVTAQLKALIDRCQTLWARKYMLKLKDPGHDVRRGFVLSVGATAGKQLFDGVNLTAKYFYDGISAKFAGSLTYRRIESRGQIQDHPTMKADVAEAARALTQDLIGRRRVLFACRENACRSQMAAAFARLYGGAQLDAVSGGSEAAAKVNPAMVEAMQEKGIDMGFAVTRTLEDAIAGHKPEIIVTMGCGEACPVVPNVIREDWDLPDPAGQSMETMRRVRDEIEAKVKALIESSA